jgi:flagellar protein FliO/FliZ
MAAAIRFFAACGTCLILAGSPVARAQEPAVNASGTSSIGAGGSKAFVTGSITTSVTTLNPSTSSPSSTSAASAVVAGSTGATTLSSGGGISILGYVVSVIVLAAAAVTILLRGGFSGMFSGASKVQRKLHIEETRTVGHRQHLVVASYEGRRFLLGVCPGSIEYLSGLDSEPLSAEGSFQELLASDATRAGGAKSAVHKAEPHKADPHKDAP